MIPMSEPSTAPSAFEALMFHSPDLVWIVNRQNQINFVSPAVQRELGWNPSNLVGARGDMLVPPEELDLHTTMVKRLLTKPGKATSIEMQVLRADGTRCWVGGTATNLLEEPSLGGIVFNTRNVDQRHRFEQDVVQRGFFDELTKLPTTALFVDRLDQAIQLASHDLIIKVLYIDIENFTAVNAQLGFGAGDELLRQTAARLEAALPSTTILGRSRNDEFLVAQVSAESNRGELVVAINKVFGDAFVLGDRTARVASSIGLATTTRSDTSATELIQKAAAASFEAARHGSGQAVTWSEPMNARAVFKRQTEGELAHALSNGELRLHYQPVMDIVSRKAVGIEALVRWEHPNRGLIPPSEFITIAEETGLITEIGYWVIEETLRLLTEINRGLPDRNLFATVNFSPRQLADPALLSRTRAAISRAGADPNRLMLDITEASLQGAQTQVGNQLRRLSQLGVSLAIDDFGTGSSSLNLLREVPASYLKIDRDFTNEVTTTGTDLVMGIIAVAHALGLTPVAEGVETEEQLEKLRSLGCGLSQGYLHARPLPKDELIAFLEQSPTAPHTAPPAANNASEPAVTGGA